MKGPSQGRSHTSPRSRSAAERTVERRGEQVKLRYEGVKLTEKLMAEQWDGQPRGKDGNPGSRGPVSPL